jgi:hypothetical protein
MSNQNLPAAPMTLEKAITTVLASMPEEGKLIQAMARKDIVALGTDEAFVLRDSQGEIRAFRQSLTLSLAAGTLVQPVPGGPSVISAQGYEHWQEAVGASVIFPKEVLVDQQWQPNPAVIRDPQNRRILAIYARAVAFRFSSKGIPQVSDWSTIFDTPSYRLIDLLGKAKKFPQAFKLLPADMGKPEDPGTWASYPFDESTNLWVNTAHEEALTWFAQILNREKKAIDFAQTFAKRNALKHLSGLQKAPGPNWTLPVLCWRPTSGNIVKWDATTYANLREKVGGLITSGGDEFTAPPETMTGSERVSDEAGVEELERQVDPEDQTDVVDAEFHQAPEPNMDMKPTLSPEDLKAKLNFDETKKLFPSEHAEACMTLKVPSMFMSQDQAGKVLAKIAQILEGTA